MNTCLEAGASARAELKARAAAYAAGAKVRDGYIKQSRKSRAEWQAQLKRVSSEAAQQQLKVDQAKGVPVNKHSLCMSARHSAIHWRNATAAARLSTLPVHDPFANSRLHLLQGRKRKQRAASDQPRTQQVSRMTRRALPGTSTSTLQAAGGQRSTVVFAPSSTHPDRQPDALHTSPDARPCLLQ